MSGKRSRNFNKEGADSNSPKRRSRFEPVDDPPEVNPDEFLPVPIVDPFRNREAFNLQPILRPADPGAPPPIPGSPAESLANLTRLIQPTNDSVLDMFSILNFIPRLPFDEVNLERNSPFRISLENFYYSEGSAHPSRFRQRFQSQVSFVRAEAVQDPEMDAYTNRRLEYLDRIVRLMNPPSVSHVIPIRQPDPESQNVMARFDTPDEDREAHRPSMFTPRVDREAHRPSMFTPHVDREAHRPSMFTPHVDREAHRPSMFTPHVDREAHRPSMFTPHVDWEAHRPSMFTPHVDREAHQPSMFSNLVPEDRGPSNIVLPYVYPGGERLNVHLRSATLAHFDFASLNLRLCELFDEVGYLTNAWARQTIEEGGYFYRYMSCVPFSPAYADMVEHIESNHIFVYYCMDHLRSIMLACYWIIYTNRYVLAYVASFSDYIRAMYARYVFSGRDIERGNVYGSVLGDLYEHLRRAQLHINHYLYCVTAFDRLGSELDRVLREYEESRARGEERRGLFDSHEGTFIDCNECSKILDSIYPFGKM